MDLAAFLRDRLAEDEAAAKESGPACVAWLTYRGDDGRMLYTTVAAGGEGHGDPWVADGRELPAPTSARVVYDPARVLREVEAGRKLLARYELACATPESTVSGFIRGQDDGYRQACLDAIHDRAAVYSGHTDYRAEWKP